MNTDLMDTTRCYARTLEQAFPSEQAPVIEHCTPSYSRLANKAVMWACAVGALVVVLIVAFGGQP